MKRCVIFASLPPGEIPEIKDNDLVIACDKGVLHAKECGARIDLAMGDFDSWDGDMGDISVMRFPAEKDDTDTMLAIKKGLKRGCRDFFICGALGGRIDHTAANIQALRFLYENGASGALSGEGERITLVAGGKREFPRREGYSFSVLSLTDTARGVTLSGVHYPLDGGTLKSSFPLGHGNKITAQQAGVSVLGGAVIVIESKL